MNTRTTSVRSMAVAAAVLAMLVGGVAPALAKGGHHRNTSRQGYDISYPQCGGTYPADPAFGIVGVTHGLPWSANPCLADEYRWAQPHASLYLNTANPGPALSSHWPAGQTAPQVCDGSWSTGCSYDYGWNAADDAFTRVASGALGSVAAASSAWWLDVETANSWSTDTTTNVAALQGFADYLRARAVPSVGVYSTSYQWGRIAGGSTTAFAATPNWVAGASAATARSYCGASFTGGPVTYVQYPSGGFDADLAC